MTGPELRALMKLRRIRTAEAARALGIHPQTIRNLWSRDEVPRLYLMALITYGWALGMDHDIWAQKVTKPVEDEDNPIWTKKDFAKAKPFREVFPEPEVEEEKPIEKRKDSVWNRLT